MNNKHQQSKYVGIWVWILCSYISVIPISNAKDLDTLLQEVKKSQWINNKQNKAREQRFKAQRDKRKALLQQARKELNAALAYSKKLKKALQENDKKLLDIEQQISKKSSNVGELFGVVRQMAGETLAKFNHSMISAQYPQRKIFLEKLTDHQSLPAMDDLKQLWYEMQRQMTEAGKIRQFKQFIITTEGKEAERFITRVGEFNAISEGKYLQYLEKTQQFVEVAHQPPQNFLTMAKALEIDSEGVKGIAIDPSRGSLLSLLGQIPDIKTRIQQGGIIGYIILSIGLLAIFIALERYLYLSFISYKIHRQQKREQALTDNPLGRIMAIYYQNIQHNVEALSLKLDEAILVETPRLEKRLLILGLFATVAPLLGLLGTVVGMIETFQSIALFGTGDPKLMSGGISQALVTTGLGLIVAIPIILLHGFLQTKSNRLIQILDEESAGYVAHLAEQSMQRQLAKK